MLLCSESNYRANACAVRNIFTRCKALLGVCFIVRHLQNDFFVLCKPECVACAVMTDVMISATPMDNMRLSPSKERLTFQIFPDPSDFERCCKLKDRLPSIVVEPTEGEVESGELRWPPEEFLVSEEDEDEEECDGNLQNGQMQNSQH
ncbi:protein LBH isoform X1 [Carassius gibelio]|nr:protein LBH isoform X1 [Carassius gibelio]